MSATTRAPQYFGYLANNPAYRSTCAAWAISSTDMTKGRLPAEGGVFYIRGGFTNIEGMKPPIQNPTFPRR